MNNPMPIQLEGWETPLISTMLHETSVPILTFASLKDLDRMIWWALLQAGEAGKKLLPVKEVPVIELIMNHRYCVGHPRTVDTIRSRLDLYSPGMVMGAMSRLSFEYTTLAPEGVLAWLHDPGETGMLFVKGSSREHPDVWRTGIVVWPDAVTLIEIAGDTWTERLYTTDFEPVKDDRPVGCNTRTAWSKIAGEDDF